eukprot:jgi/Galph1/1530/GphlegSOOS_G213.1
MNGVELDLGSLLASDLNPVTVEETKEDIEKRATTAIEYLIHGLFTLPTMQSEGKNSSRQLPEPKSVVPRAKPIPKEKPLTRWEQFAKGKGVSSYHGYRSINDERDQWVMEHDPSLEPGVSPFDVIREGKRRRVAQNEKNRERNRRKAPMPSKDTHKSRVQSPALSDKYKKSLNVAAVSTSSLGKREDNAATRKGKKAARAQSSTTKKKLLSNKVEHEKTSQVLSDVLKQISS